MPDDDYEVGYRKPPKHTRFRKGKSGNPKGRPKGSKNLQTLIATELDERVVVTEAGSRRRVTKREALIKRLVNDGLTGKASSQKLLLVLLQSEAASDIPDAPTFAELDEADKQTLRAFERQARDETLTGTGARAASGSEGRKRRRGPRVPAAREGYGNDSA